VLGVIAVVHDMHVEIPVGGVAKGRPQNPKTPK
jgi:hypothetical protein